jgi:hypothetical protein
VTERKGRWSVQGFPALCTFLLTLITVECHDLDDKKWHRRRAVVFLKCPQLRSVFGSMHEWKNSNVSSALSCLRVTTHNSGIFLRVRTSVRCWPASSRVHRANDEAQDFIVCDSEGREKVCRLWLCDAKECLLDVTQTDTDALTLRAHTAGHSVALLGML